MSLNLAQRQQLVKSDHEFLSLRRQCELLGINRSVLYYEPRGESPLNLELMRLMDEHYLDHSDKGARRMHVWLTKDLVDHPVNMTIFVDGFSTSVFSSRYDA